MSDVRQFEIRKADYAKDWRSLKSIRHEVFVIGQQVPADLEWAGDDDQYWHVLAIDAARRPIGTGRLSADGKIGRMAVVSDWRGMGVGSAMLEQLIAIAEIQQMTTLKLSSQLAAVPFYQRHGFLAEGEVFVEANIDHRWMARHLDR